jgi:hypothetical protein
MNEDNLVKITLTDFFELNSLNPEFLFHTSCFPKSALRSINQASFILIALAQRYFF